MASYYKRKNSPYYWIKFYNHETRKVERHSTAKWLRINNEVTPALVNSKGGERIAKDICEEIKAAKRFGVAPRTFFEPIKELTPIKDVWKHFIRLNLRKDSKTKQEYEWFYKILTDTFPEKLSVSELNKDSVESFLLGLDNLTYTRKVRKGKKIVEIEKPYSQNSKFVIQKNLVKFLNFLFEYKYLPEYFKINRDVRLRPEVREKITFTAEDITKILNGLSPKGTNFQITIYLLLYTGLRSSEIISIDTKRVDLERETFQYYSKKGKEWRTVPIHPELLPKIEKRIKEIGFGTLSEYKTEEALNRAFRRYLKELGIDGKGYSARTFRKSFDTWAYDNDVDTVANSRLVGHSLATAEKHYRQVEIEKLRKELKKFKVPVANGHTKK